MAPNGFQQNHNQRSGSILTRAFFAGEVNNLTADIAFISPKDRGRADLQVQEPSSAELMNQSMDKSGGLSRLNPHVPPRLRDGRLKMQRCGVCTNPVLGMILPRVLGFGAYFFGGGVAACLVHPTPDRGSTMLLSIVLCLIAAKSLDFLGFQPGFIQLSVQYPYVG